MLNNVGRPLNNSIRRPFLETEFIGFDLSVNDVPICWAFFGSLHCDLLASGTVHSMGRRNRIISRRSVDINIRLCV